MNERSGQTDQLDTPTPLPRRDQSRAAMTTARMLLAAAGAGMAAYGGWLLAPQLAPVAPWLIAGPLLHDLLVAPLVGLVGLTLRHMVSNRVRFAWLTTGVAVSATLLLITLPLIWRPAAAPPNPGLQDRDYLAGLTIWLALLWIGLMVGYWSQRRGRSSSAARGEAVPHALQEHRAS